MILELNWGWYELHQRLYILDAAAQIAQVAKPMLFKMAGVLTLGSASNHNWYTGTFLNRIIIVQWEGMGDEGSVRYEPA